MSFQRVFWIVLVCLFFLNTGMARANTPVFFTFNSDNGCYNFEGSFGAKADMDVVWSVLTDYKHVSNFISNMNSHVKKESGNDLLVEQEAGGGFLIIQEHVKALLEVHEDPFQSVSFNDVSHRDFKLYSGVWHLLPDALTGEVKVTYELLAARNKKTPGFLTADLFGGSLGDLLDQTQREISKRQLRKEKKAQETAHKSATAAPTPIGSPVPTAVKGPALVSAIK
jgi:hypothetical protein